MPLAPIPPELARRLTELGGRPTNLYRALAHQPHLVEPFAHLALTLRHRCSTPRRLRELMIIRAAQVCGSTYELKHHTAMAPSVGIAPEELEELAAWERSALFSPAERAALRYTEEIMRLKVTDSTVEELRKRFTDAERIELTLTAAFYAMVPRIVDALGEIPE